MPSWSQASSSSAASILSSSSSRDASKASNRVRICSKAVLMGTIARFTALVAADAAISSISFPAALVATTVFFFVFIFPFSFAAAIACVLTYAAELCSRTVAPVKQKSFNTQTFAESSSTCTSLISIDMPRPGRFRSRSASGKSFFHTVASTRRFLPSIQAFVITPTFRRWSWRFISLA